MECNPYQGLPSAAFWRSAVVSDDPFFVANIYKKKFNLDSRSKIATVGSCFAQHIASNLRAHGFNVLDVEPSPPGLAPSQRQKYGYSMYSARYGNVYTVRQFLQIVRELSKPFDADSYVWSKNGRYYDAFRPAVEPDGLCTKDEVIEHRKYHLEKVRSLFRELDVLIFTLGLTETWVSKTSGICYPTAPGTIAGSYDSNIYKFHNLTFSETLKDFNQAIKSLKKLRDGKNLKIILTVSPVPLTATASGNHVLTATTYSKAILRSVAGQLSSNKNNIDYFPSYEIVHNPRLHSVSFEENLRTVRPETVKIVMKHFFSQHSPIIDSSSSEPKARRNSKLAASSLAIESVQCEEALLEAFSS